VKGENQANTTNAAIIRVTQLNQKSQHAISNVQLTNGNLF